MRIRHFPDLIIEYSPIPAAWLDLQFNYIRVSRGYAKADKRDPSFFIGKNYFDLYPDPENEAIFRQVVQTGEPWFAYPKPSELSDGTDFEPIWHWSLIPITDRRGEMCGLLLFVTATAYGELVERILKAYRNRLEELVEERTAELIRVNEKLKKEIEDHLRAENALRESEQKFKALFETMSEGVALHELIVDEQGNPVDYVILDVNPSFQAHTGIDPKTIIGKRASEGYGTGKAPYLNIYAKVAQTRIPYRFEAYVKSIKKYYSISVCSPGQNRFATILRDITERKRTEEALKESEQRFRSIIDNTDAGYFFIDKEGIIRSVNRSWLKLYKYSSPEEVIGQHFRLIQRIHDLDKATEFVNGILRGDPKYQMGEFSRKCKDGSIGYHSFSARPVVQHGEVIGIEGFIIDITERMKAEEQLRDLNDELEERVAQRTAELSAANLKLQLAKEASESAYRAKSDFLAKMSHELRTPLNIILGFTQLMERDRTISHDHREMLIKINQNAVHLLELINEILDMSKIEAGRMKVIKQSFDFYRMAIGVEDMMRIRAESKRLQFSVKISSEVPRYIRTDERKLRQVLFNLIENAVKFTEKGSIEIRIDLSEQNRQHLCFEVRDTGAGISPDEMDNLFEAFFQTHQGQQIEGSTGLGLAISRKFIQLMGGDISVESRVGIGTVFRFYIAFDLPDSHDIQPEASIRKVVGLEPNQTPYRILIADDNSDNRLFMRRVLQSIGFEVAEAVNGQAAVECFNTWYPHLILMDVRMPLMNGVDAARQIKSTLRGQATAVIALTSSMIEDDHLNILDFGCDDYIRKPIYESELLMMIEKHLGVRYVYEDSGSAPEPARTGIPIVHTVSIPEDLAAELKHSLEDLDMEGIDAAIEKIRQIHPDFARSLQALSVNFEYDEMLRLLQ